MSKGFGEGMTKVLCVALVTAGCNTTRSDTSQIADAGQIDSAVARCLGTALGGAVIGALIGAASGSSQRVAVGAGVGAAVGGVGCAVLTALDAQDKARIREAQISAAAINQPRFLSYQGTDGRMREIKVRTKPVPTQSAEANNRLCRLTDVTATIDGAGTTELPQQMVCRTKNGDWLPA